MPGGGRGEAGPEPERRLAALGLLYSLTMFVGAGWEATAWGVVLASIAVPIRAVSRRYWPSRAPAAAPSVPRE